MSRSRSALLFGLMLVASAVVGVEAPAWAHTAAAARLVEDATAPVIGDVPTVVDAHPGIALTAAPEAPGLPWPALLGAIVLAALGWRRPRRALAFGLVLLLTLFAFEGGLHSVHHGMDQGQRASCPLAAASAQLAATAVDCLVSADVILPTAATDPENDPTAAIVRSPSPDQGRAPPSATV
jgi:hypothetical protein